MCSRTEAKIASKEAMEEEVFTVDSTGHTRFAKEVHNAVFNEAEDGHPSRFQRELKKAFYSTFGKWFFGGGAVIMIGLVSIYFQVQENTQALSEGGRYTEADAIQDGRLQESRDARQDEDIQNLRDEINRKLDILLERL